MKFHQKKTCDDPFRAVRGPSPSVVSEMFGVPVVRVRDQYRRNAAQLREMAEKARTSGGRWRGYTADQLDKHAASAEAKAAQ